MNPRAHIMKHPSSPSRNESLRMISVQTPILTVPDEDLHLLASALGVADPIEGGLAVCTLCGEAISNFSEVFALYPAPNGTVGIVDRKSKCIRAFGVLAQREGIS